MPYAFEHAGWLWSTIFLGFLCGLAFCTVTFIVETMAVANWLHAEQNDGILNRGKEKAELKATIILKLAEPEEIRCYRNQNTSFSAEICWSNVQKYPYFPSKKLRRS